MPRIMSTPPRDPLVARPTFFVNRAACRNQARSGNIPSSMASRSPFGSPVTGARLQRVRASPQFADGVFRNPGGERPRLKRGTAWSTVGDFLFGGQARTPPAPLPADDPRPLWHRRPDGGLRATWLGHSTVLVEIDGLRVLTDPV